MCFLKIFWTSDFGPELAIKSLETGRCYFVMLDPPKSLGQVYNITKDVCKGRLLV